MNKANEIQAAMRELKLSVGCDELREIIAIGEKENLGFLEYTLCFLKKELAMRETRRIQNNLKMSRLPRACELDKYDYRFANGLTRTQINQLRELRWLEDKFNLILLGPPGIGKTYIASGLGYDAIKQGYRVLFRTMDEIITILKLKETTITAQREYRRLGEAELVIIDDMMSFPPGKPDAVNMFHLINRLHERSSNDNNYEQGAARMEPDFKRRSRRGRYFGQNNV